MAKQLAGVTKAELMARILSKRLKLPLQECLDVCELALEKKKGKRPEADFDISKYGQHLVAVKFFYFGDKYRGFATQAGTCMETIEGQLLEAAKKTRLVPSDVSSSAFHWSRCGRTDKGVSSFGNVVTFLSRKGVDPMQKLNQQLPSDIRVTSWSTTEKGVKRLPGSQELFDARFDCRGRSYKYLFYEDGMDIEKMIQGAKKMEGFHDFRNFCKIDVQGTLSWTRHINSIKIEQIGLVNSPLLPKDQKKDQLYCATISGTAFLYHQIRCMMAVLFMIGRGQEDPCIVDALLDIEKVPGKPEYHFEDGFPLILDDCRFEGLEFKASIRESSRMCSELYTRWRRINMEREMIELLLRKHITEEVTIKPHTQLYPMGKCKPYVPLLNRVRGMALEDIKEQFETKKRNREQLEDISTTESSL